MSLRDRVIAALCCFGDAGKPFTLLDVSNTVKEDGQGFVRHREVRPVAVDIIVNQEVREIQDYTMTSIEVNTSKGPAWANLYHPDDFDPDDYQDRSQDALRPNQVKDPVKNTKVDFNDDDLVTQSLFKTDDVKSALGTSTPVVNDSNDDDDHDDDDEFDGRLSNARYRCWVYRRQYDGAVEIPVKALEVAFEEDIDSVLEDFEESGTITVHPNSLGISTELDGSIGVTIRRGMRIPLRHLVKCGLDKKNQILVACFNGKIVLA
jgi:hypothetical protein